MDRIEFKAISDVGLIRDNNEDSFIAELLWDDRHILCAAIDGVGGYEGGEVAAEIARSTIIEFLNKYPDNNLQDVIAQAVLQANNSIFEQRKNGPFPNMSCVVSAAIIDANEDKIYVAHVGDSRIYLYDKGVLTKITHDHSLVGYREEIGELSEEEAMNHPRRNIIERCLGEEERVFGDGNFVDNAVYDIPADAKLVFCSDGLTDMVTGAEIKQILATEKDTAIKCQMLIDCAKRHGGKDNVTVVLVETHKSVVASKETIVSYSAEKAPNEQEANSKDEVGSDIQKREDNTKNKKGCRLGKSIVFVLVLVVGFVFGYYIGNKAETQNAEDVSYSWEGVLRWIEINGPVDSLDYSLIGEQDSIKMSIEKYRQLMEFYDSSIPRIIEKIEINRALIMEKDSLMRVISIKDSLLNSEARLNDDL